MTERTIEWLHERAADVPPSLESRMEAAVLQATGSSITAVLSSAARNCLRDALKDPDSRASAFDLLAADALVTYACEAALDGDALADEWSTESLSRLIGTDGIA